MKLTPQNSKKNRVARYGNAQRFSLRFWLVALVLLFARIPSSHAADKVQVIINSAAPVRDLSRTSLRAIFSMRMRRLPDGTPVTVIVLPDLDERHRAFCKDVLRIYPYVLRDTWDRLVFTGTGQAPTEVANQEELIKRVAQTRGAIGYVVQDAKLVNERLRTVEIYEAP